MPKYLIKWNVGYGDNTEVVEAPNKDEADNMSYAAWKEEAEFNAEYCSYELTKEIAEDYGHEAEFKD